MNILTTLLHTVSKPNAYLDPGSGSIILQMILAGILGIGVFLKVFWKKITGLFRHGKAHETKTVDPTEISEEDQK